MRVGLNRHKATPSWSSLGAPYGNAGVPVQFGTENVPELFGGRPNYLLGLLIYVTFQFDKVAATMPGAMPGEEFGCGLTNIIARTADHVWWDRVDGLDLRRDVELRTGNYIEALQSDESDADETNGTQACVFQFNFGNPGAEGPAMFDGALPVRFFNRELNARNGLEITIASTFASFLGVTIDGASAFQAYWLCGATGQPNQLKIPTAYSVSWLADAPGETHPKFPVPWGPVEYFYMGPRADDATTHGFDLSGFSGLDFWIGGDYVHRQATPTDIARAFIAERNASIAGLSTNAQAMSTTAPPYLPLISYRPGTLRSQMAQGRMRLEIGTYSTAYDSSGVRYVKRQIGGHNPEKLAGFSDLMRVDINAAARAGNFVPAVKGGNGRYLDGILTDYRGLRG